MSRFVRRIQQGVKVSAPSLGATTISVTDFTVTTITLNWTTVSGATGYLVGRDETDASDDGPWQSVDGTSATSRTFIDLLPDTVHALLRTSAERSTQSNDCDDEYRTSQLLTAGQ